MQGPLDAVNPALDTVIRAGAPSWLMITLGLLMFGGWTATYIAIIVKSFRDKAYGIPFPNICLNFSWELIFSLNLAGGLPRFFFPLQIGHALWLIPDAFILYQTFRYGRGMQKHTWVAKRFIKLFLATFALSFLMIYTYHAYARDVYGVASSWVINVFMSALFIQMFLDRYDNVAPDGTIRGISLKACWFKLIGNTAGAIFCFFWWPAQFINGQLMHGGVTVLEPPSFLFLYVLYVANFLLDVGLIFLVQKREAELRQVVAQKAIEVSVVT